MERDKIKIQEKSFSFEWKIPKYNSLDKDLQSPLFVFSRCTWNLMVANLGTKKSLLLIPLMVSEPGEKKITCFPGCRKADGRMMKVNSVDVNLTQHEEGEPFALWEFKDYPELASLETLIITCRLEEDAPHSVKSSSLPSKKLELKKLSLDFGDLFTSKKECDVIVKVGDKEFQAHKVVLVARSSVFDAMFEHDMSEKETGVINVPDCDADSFEDFLYYLYTGKFERVSAKNAHHLYVTSDKYDVNELKSFCVTYMAKNVTLENMFDIVQLADRYDSEELMFYVQRVFNKNFNKILGSADWEILTKENFPLSNKLLKGMSEHFKIKDHP